jgi:ferredoxin
MAEVELKFENENRSGVVAVGSYLIDAAHRLGVEIEAICERRGECDSCAMKITQGGDLLSAPTSAESKQLGEQRINAGERLSCQTKLEKAGEIVIMITQKNEENKPETEEEKAKEYRKEFEELPLEKKIASLLELEFLTLSETFTFVLNSPFKIVDKAMEVMAEFGLKLEEKDKEAKRPKEHKAEENGKEVPPKKTQAKKTTQTKKSAAQKDTK